MKTRESRYRGLSGSLKRTDMSLKRTDDLCQGRIPRESIDKGSELICLWNALKPEWKCNRGLKK